jgi:type II secretory pathway pseudopilin PulG
MLHKLGKYPMNKQSNRYKLAACGAYVTTDEIAFADETVQCPGCLHQMNEEIKTCSHPGCQNHVTHPCEGCGKQWDKGFTITELLIILAMIGVLGVPVYIGIHFVAKYW